VCQMATLNGLLAKQLENVGLGLVLIYRISENPQTETCRSISNASQSLG
jgi:hypothetical protein